MRGFALTVWIGIFATSCTSTESDPASGVRTEARSPELQRFVTQARAHVEAGRFTEAVRVAQTGLSQDSTDVQLCNLLATAEAAQGRYGPATDALERALRAHPDFALGHLNLGGMYYKLGDFAKAEPHLVRASELLPDQSSSVHRRLTELYLNTDRAALAIDSAQRADAAFPGDATLAYYLAQSLEANGRDVDALANYRRATQIDPGFSEALYRLAGLARRLGERALADSAFERFGRLRQIGGNAEAPKQLEKLRAALMNAPEDAVHHLRLGGFFVAHGFVDEAQSRFARTLQLRPGEPGLAFTIGDILHRTGNHDLALGYYGRSVALDSSFVPALRGMAALLEARGDVEAALQFEQRALASERLRAAQTRDP